MVATPWRPFFVGLGVIPASILRFPNLAAKIAFATPIRFVLWCLRHCDLDARPAWDCRMQHLTHLGPQGDARMVDVGEKPISARTARATATVHMQVETMSLLLTTSLQKGDVLATARIAGIQAAKKTAELVPLCHSIALDSIAIDLSPSSDCRLEITAEVACRGRTGVEMEALTAVAVAALTVYDMCKSVDREMTIESIQLQEKTGGRSGHFSRGN